MYAVVVSFDIKPEAVAQFMPLMLENARSSLRDEEGCYQFDVCTDPGRPGEVFLYELYETRAAFDVHLTMPHYKTFDTATAPMIATKHVKTFEKVEQ